MGRSTILGDSLKCRERAGIVAPIEQQRGLLISAILLLQKRDRRVRGVEGRQQRSGHRVVVATRTYGKHRPFHAQPLRNIRMARPQARQPVLELLQRSFGAAGAEIRIPVLVGNIEVGKQALKQLSIRRAGRHPACIRIAVQGYGAGRKAHAGQRAESFRAARLGEIMIEPALYLVSRISLSRRRGTGRVRIERKNKKPHQHRKAHLLGGHEILRGHENTPAAFNFGSDSGRAPRPA